MSRRTHDGPSSPTPTLNRSRSTERSLSSTKPLERSTSSGELQEDSEAVEEYNIDSERARAAFVTETAEDGDGDDKKKDKRKMHRRAMSDPFDTADCGGATDSEVPPDSIPHAESFDTVTDALPTLPRYPYAATRNKNCWSEPSVSIFHVRGPRYLENKKKVSSGPYLLPARGVDLFVTDSPHDYRLGE